MAGGATVPAPIAEQLSRQPLVGLWPAILRAEGPDPVLLTHGRLARLVRYEVDVIDDAEVEPAVAVVVEERGGRPPDRLRESGLRGHIDETHAALVEEQFDAMELRDDDVGFTIVIDVADGDAHVPAGEVESRTGADVFEGMIRLLAEDLVGGFRLGTPVGEQDQVGESVAIQVHDREAGPDALVEMAFFQFIAGIVDERHAGLVRNILEPGRSIGRLGFRARRRTYGNGRVSAAAPDQQEGPEREVSDAGPQCCTVTAEDGSALRYATRSLKSIPS